tara:strand:+ start:752 stop:1024 length:273 start_codon:yes stop_codon:yes gene_type:complete
MKKFSLIELSNGQKFVRLYANKEILNSQCNSTIFKNKEDSYLKISIFEYLNIDIKILYTLDMRFKIPKNLVKEYGYFSVSKIKSDLIVGN